MVPVITLALVVGQVISLQNVIGKKARLMTREIYCIYLYSRKGKLECSSHDNKRS